ncbi:MAG: NTP transferase domain-containing protein [Nitrosopumilaceae archaeon]|jgi:adenosylcobinamide-phosphate guanylyltransferase|uniref:NTP transferase domain-containing protein n=3 Tax=Candidatus Nitrosomaritimum aestuariumsis TaxID=3342354 RepID=A0AC60W9H7_9ARCH|nr:NTP transferase domain-containing protein [Nitrosopumilaceae archaeon]MBA4453893.1 NTP transferase domain-containing protein [Nitrosopumilaceae archaeon]MBA4460570.1 NTP transferase domain-containing protein [Nitrosopumilaceae archaeon]MBA4461953.1 NTP transferase domain-containing protein [Nitrosopumilaceae archaeon]MBA4463989.1 NTP transferase domain-containing protein [Nitrosopumilaceae archaeon]
MIAIVMAGGKGSRMKSSDEKLLLPYKKPIILHVADALSDSDCFSEIIFITSPNSPKTKKLLLENNYKIIDSTGQGYVQDLNNILQSIGDSVFVTSADLPLLDQNIIKKITSLYDENHLWTSILVTKNFLKKLGISSNYEVNYENQVCYYSGISMINSKKISNLDNIEENFVIIDDKRIGFNVNTKEDYVLLGTT